MRGNQPTLGDIELNFHELVLPDNLLCDEVSESLSPDCEPEEEQELQTYRVDTHCHICGTGVRICVAASIPAIQLLQELLFSSLALLCPRCSRGHFNHGRFQ
uniref:Protein E7 n=1 Tax=Human papillomavirus TaxID=10566 RepID=A0A385PK43_9PAPI|nr:MAG: E7 protein [Human papillomavirus]